MSIHGVDHARWGVIATLGAALLAHAVIVINYIRALPAFDWPDAPAHVQYVRAVGQGHLPGRISDDVWRPRELELLKQRHFRGIERADDAAVAGFAYEGHQPPLYYLAAGALFRLTNSLWDVRMLNLAFSCGALVLFGLLARHLCPDRPIVAAGAVWFAALHPMRAYMAGSIGNDPLSELVFTAFALAAVRSAPPWAIGVLAGIGLLTKAHLALMVPLYGVLVLGDGRVGSGRALKSVVTAAGLALLVASPWLVRSASLHGWLDPLGLQGGAWASGTAETQAMGQPRPVLELAGPHGLAAFFALLYQSWWGVFGWMSMFVPDRIYALYVLLTLVPVGGGIRLWRLQGRALGLEPHAARAAAWLVLVLACQLAAVLVYATHDFEAQGRYLLSAFAGSAFIFGLGWSGLPARGAWVGLAAAIVLMAGMNAYICRATIPWYLGL